MARFVLVHGAFGGAWSWGEFIGELERAGHSVIAIDLPGSGDDAMGVRGTRVGERSVRVEFSERLGGPEPRSVQTLIVLD